MLAQVWILIAAIGAFQMFFVIRGRLPDVVGPMIGIGLGIMLAYGALGFEVVSGGGQVRQQPEPELALLGLAILGTNAILLFTDAIESLELGSLVGSR
jgi:hypothetical protein